jgi:hypothetical protein
VGKAALALQVHSEPPHIRDYFAVILGEKANFSLNVSVEMSEQTSYYIPSIREKVNLVIKVKFLEEYPSDIEALENLLKQIPTRSEYRVKRSVELGYLEHTYFVIAHTSLQTLTDGLEHYCRLLYEERFTKVFEEAIKRS